MAFIAYTSMLLPHLYVEPTSFKTYLRFSILLIVFLKFLVNSNHRKFSVQYVVYHYHAMALLMFEWSTPFMNIFFMADQIETKMDEAAALQNKLNADKGIVSKPVEGAPAWFKTTTFILSGLFALAFLLVRMIWGQYHYFQFYRVCWNLWYETPAWFNISLMALIVVAFLLNGTWMIQIILTGLNVLPKPDPNSELANTGGEEKSTFDSSKSAQPVSKSSKSDKHTKSPVARKSPSNRRARLD